MPNGCLLIVLVFNLFGQTSADLPSVVFVWACRLRGVHGGSKISADPISFATTDGNK